MAPTTRSQHIAPPPSPSRVRLVRPSFYREATTGALAPDVRDLLFGLTTMADDAGWLLWRPAEIGATLYGYTAAGRRTRDLERRTLQLVSAGLLELHDCGCAYLPTLVEHHRTKGGPPPSIAIWKYHDDRHNVVVRSPTLDDVPVLASSSSSSSSSVEGEASSSSRARDDAPGNGAGDVCDECHRPTAVHSPKCSRAGHLLKVVAP